MADTKNVTPDELRSILIAAGRSVIEGKITVQQANALASLSAEVHKSLKMEYVGQILAKEKLGIDQGKIISLMDKAA